MLSRNIDSAYKKIGIFSVNNDSFQPFQHREVDGFMCLVPQLHQYWPCGFSYYVGTEYTGAEGSDTQAQGVFMVVLDRKSTRLNSSHGYISYAVFCLKKKNAICNGLLMQTTFS